jgi:hypothetical protein
MSAKLRAQQIIGLGALVLATCAVDLMNRRERLSFSTPAPADSLRDSLETVHKPSYVARFYVNTAEQRYERGEATCIDEQEPFAIIHYRTMRIIVDGDSLELSIPQEATPYARSIALEHFDQHASLLCKPVVAPASLIYAQR